MTSDNAGMFVCNSCGTFSESTGECSSCGAQLVPLEEALGYQGQLFELEGNDLAADVLRHLRRDVSKTADAVRRAEETLVTLRNSHGESLQTLLNFFKLALSGEKTDLAVFSATLTDAERSRKVEDEARVEPEDTSEPPLLQCEAGGCDYYDFKTKSATFAAMLG